MTSYDVMQLFAEQLERNVQSTQDCKVKVVITPSSIREKGVVIKVSLLKTTPDKVYQAKTESRSVRLRVSVQGTIESQEGLRQAVEMVEALDRYLQDEKLRLEKIIEGENSMQAVRKIPNTRITCKLSEEDSFIDNPDSTDVQDIQDDRTVTITIPEEI